ncbi:MAG: SDR family oxidoreductase [Steroidobacteraceae bacterium]
MRRMKVLAVALGWLASMTMASQAQAATVLITGANRGIGLEFAKQYAALGWRVIATYRSAAPPDSLTQLAADYPGLVQPARMDVLDLAMIDAVAGRYQDTTIDVLINNAAVVGNLRDAKPQSFGTLDYELFDTFMRTNVRGPLKVSEAFRSNVTASERKTIVMVTSLAGSFTAASQNLPGRVFYKTSKAALNMAMSSIATATKGDGLTVVAIHPGGVKVEKLQDFDVPGFMEPQESVSSMIRVISELTPAQTGAFLNFDGEPLTW